MSTERKDSIIVGRGAWRWLQGRLRTLEAERAECADEALRLTRRNAELRRAAASLAEKARSTEHRLYREQRAWEEAGRRSEDEIAIQRAVASEIGRKYVEEVRKHEVTKCERDTLDTELRNERKARLKLSEEVQELRRKVSQSVMETKLDPGAAPSTVHVDAPRPDLKCPCCGWRVPRVLWDAAKMDLVCPRCRMPLIWFTQIEDSKEV